MATCPQCHADTPDGAVFCVACGASMKGPANAESRPTSKGPANAESRPTSKRHAAAAQATVPGAPLEVAMAPAAAPPARPAPTEDADPPAPAAIPLAPQAGAVPRRAVARQLGAGMIVDQKYAIERILGEGGMGVVYLARDVHTGMYVVLKAMRKELAHRADVRARTLAEGRALAQIDHPNVVHLNAVVADGDDLWLVMQFIDGESLDHTIERNAAEGLRMPLAEALSIFRQVVAGISAAHREGVIHRDLKPGNVLLRRKDGTAKVTDFGIAKGEADALAGRGQTKGIIGSICYMSPEQVTGRRDLDKRVDIYALGIVLYEMLVGRVPFDAENDWEIMRQHTEAPIPSVRAARPDVPPEIDAIIQKACAKDRAARFASCDELLAALDAASRAHAPAAAAVAAATPVGSATEAGAPPAPVPTTTLDIERASAAPRAAGGRRWPWAVLVVAVAGGGAAAALFALDLLPAPAPGRPKPADVRPQGGAAPPTATATAAPTPDAPPPPPSPLAPLAGAWVGNGRELDAVLSGDTLEFRIKSPEQFAPQDYHAGEARFSLREIPGEPGVFAVEDRLRFIAPDGRTFDPARARGTCQELRTAAEGRPLRASFDGVRLTIEFAKLEPTRQNFVTEGKKVVSCVGLGTLAATRVVSTLARP